MYSFASDGNTLVIDYHYFPVHELDLKKTSLTLNDETLDKLKDRYGEEEFFKQYRDCKILVASDLGQDNAAAVTTSLNFFGREYLKEKQLALLVSSRTLFYIDWKVRGWSLWHNKISKLSKKLGAAGTITAGAGTIAGALFTIPWSCRVMPAQNLGMNFCVYRSSY